MGYGKPLYTQCLKSKTSTMEPKCPSHVDQLESPLDMLVDLSKSNKVLQACSVCLLDLNLILSMGSRVCLVLSSSTGDKGCESATWASRSSILERSRWRSSPEAPPGSAPASSAFNATVELESSSCVCPNTGSILRLISMSSDSLSAISARIVLVGWYAHAWY